jgi:isoleucyl-tRNA synthetase
MDDASVALLRETDLAEICITSGATLEVGEGPDDAFRLDDLKNVAVVPHPATGTKCARSWRYTHDIGQDSEYPDVSARDAAALRELRALGRL